MIYIPALCCLSSNPAMVFLDGSLTHCPRHNYYSGTLAALITILNILLRVFGQKISSFLLPISGVLDTLAQFFPQDIKKKINEQNASNKQLHHYLISKKQSPISSQIAYQFFRMKNTLKSSWCRLGVVKIYGRLCNCVVTDQTDNSKLTGRKTKTLSKDR